MTGEKHMAMVLVYPAYNDIHGDILYLFRIQKYKSLVLAWNASAEALSKNIYVIITKNNSCSMPLEINIIALWKYNPFRCLYKNILWYIWCGIWYPSVLISKTHCSLLWQKKCVPTTSYQHALFYYFIANTLWWNT